jgi:lipopolysaccharide/colanic/teichoic acid biosynthesis glycosyltransferase
MGDLAHMNVQSRELGGHQSHWSRAPTRSATRYAVAKRAFDIVFALAVLVATAPIVAAAVLAIRLESRGPAFFRQPRMGRGGQPFRILKLRGMYTDAAERFPGLFDYATVDREQLDSFYFHSTDDPRVTRVGRVLRRFSIDELPNFCNVLLGHMSVVGPRPEIPELADLYGGDLDALLSVRPGVTSPVKARGRASLPFADTLRGELDYVANASFRLDLKTVVRTVTGVARAEGR